MTSKQTRPGGINLDAMRRSKQIVKLQGREYVLFSGLLRTAHDNGLTSIDTEIISWEPDARAAVVRAVVEGSRGRYSAHGDASPANVGKNIASACLRMSETRAIARALRSYLGIGMTALSELPGGAGEAVEAAPVEVVPLDIAAVLTNYKIAPAVMIKHCREAGWGDPMSWDESARDQFMRDLVAGKIPALYAVKQ